MRRDLPRLGRPPIPGRPGDLRAWVSSLIERSSAGSSCSEFASHIARTKSGAVAATRVPSRNEPAASANASGTSPAVAARASASRCGRCEIAAAAASCSSDLAGTTTAPQSSAKVHHHRPHCRVDVLVHTDHPRRPDEQARVARRPAGPRGARHRMTADEVGQQAERLDLVQHATFDAGHVGQRGVRGDVANVPEHDRQRGHRHGEHDQRAGLGGAFQRLLDVLRGVEPVGLRGLDAFDRTGCNRKPRGLPRSPHASPSRRSGLDPARRRAFSSRLQGWHTALAPDVRLVSIASQDAWSGTSVSAHGTTAGTCAGPGRRPARRLRGGRRAGGRQVALLGRCVPPR